MKMVLHVSNTEQWPTAFANVRNFIQGINGAKEVVVLVNGAVVKDLVTSSFLELYHEQDAYDFKFQVCSNALKANNIDPKTLEASMEVVPSGVVQLTLLQNQGFAYIKP
jgi:hypothetical protein